jgi:hypothetical protein
MAKLTLPNEAAAGLTVRERVLLFCAASGTDWRALVDAPLRLIGFRRFSRVAAYALRLFRGAPSDTPSLDAC